MCSATQQDATGAKWPVILACLVWGAVVLSAGGCAGHPTDSAPISLRSAEPTVPALTAPPIADVRRELASMREGTGDPTPKTLRLGDPVRVFTLKPHATGDRVQDLLDLPHTRLVYPVLSGKGMEGEVTYEPWNPASYKDGGLGDFGTPVDASHGATGEYLSDLARLPSIGASSVVGVVGVAGRYRLAVAWTTTGSVGVFLPSGLGGGASSRRPSPYVPTGVLYRGDELAKLLSKAAGW